LQTSDHNVCPYHQNCFGKKSARDQPSRTSHSREAAEEKKDKLKRSSRAATAPETMTLDEEDEPEEVMMIHTPWIQAYLAYITKKEIPQDPVETRRTIRRSQ
jgi:hypothetical protein